MPWAKKPDEGYFSKRGFWKNKWTQMKTGMEIGWKKKRERKKIGNSTEETSERLRFDQLFF